MILSPSAKREWIEIGGVEQKESEGRSLPLRRGSGLKSSPSMIDAIRSACLPLRRGSGLK